MPDRPGGRPWPPAAAPAGPWRRKSARRRSGAPTVPAAIPAGPASASPGRAPARGPHGRRGPARARGRPSAATAATDWAETRKRPATGACVRSRLVAALAGADPRALARLFRGILGLLLRLGLGLCFGPGLGFCFGPGLGLRFLAGTLPGFVTGDQLLRRLDLGLPGRLASGDLLFGFLGLVSPTVFGQGLTDAAVEHQLAAVQQQRAIAQL